MIHFHVLSDCFRYAIVNAYFILAVVAMFRATEGQVCQSDYIAAAIYLKSSHCASPFLVFQLPRKFFLSS
jgi:hypothetical protein